MPTVLRAFCSQQVVSRGVWKGPWVLGEPRVNLAAKKWELACPVAWQHCLARSWTVSEGGTLSADYGL